MTHEELLSLARRVDDGFKRVDENFKRVDQVLQTLIESQELVRGELRDLKLGRDLISRAVAAEIAELRSRVSRIERKVGLVR